MPRVYKPDPRGKRYKKYSKELIEQALREYSEGRNSLSNVAEKIQINKSVLYRHSIKNVKNTVLSKETELQFIKYINVCAEWGYPMELYDLRVLVKNYLDRLGVTEKRFKNNLPGPDFTRSFLKRHSDKITQRVSQNIKRNRAAVSPDTIKEYFQQLQISISDVPIENIVNYDETNLADDPGRKKIITKRGTKYSERVMNSSKASISIMMACTAAGEILPPYVVYNAQNLFDTWIKSGPKGARYNRSQSGWFDSNIFEDWVNSMIIPFFEYKPGKKCLIGDNLSSHLSIDLIRKCYEKDIHFIFLPANSTHITQPLDVAFFRPMKIAWREIILQWKKIDGRNQSSIPKGCFPKLLSKLMEKLKENGSANVISGFRKTGINPFDSSAVLKKLPDWDNQAEQSEIVDETILEYLKDMRYGTNNIVEPTKKKKKKLQVHPGKSVLLSSDEDYIETTDPEYLV
ncbi:unnamed protein product [Parnassius apollo]|uniref:(apollo) hypothetical protein n=1 Tax=Parnassius apollo TaxID=110799 RepID=A0A8S3X5U4_PARAO|nr:unnamed protein product [Parnassius apollo]